MNTIEKIAETTCAFCAISVAVLLTTLVDTMIVGALVKVVVRMFM